MGWNTPDMFQNHLSEKVKFMTAQHLPWTHALRHQYYIKNSRWPKKKRKCRAEKAVQINYIVETRPSRGRGMVRVKFLYLPGTGHKPHVNIFPYSGRIGTYHTLSTIRTDPSGIIGRNDEL